MAFFTGGSRFHTVKRSGSPASDDDGKSKLLSMLDEIDELDESNTGDEGNTVDESNTVAEDIKPVKPEVGPSSPAAGERKTPRYTTEGEQQAIMAMAMAGKKPSEIAKIFGLRSNTVSKLITRKQKQALGAMNLEQYTKTSPTRKSKSPRAKKH